MCLIGNNVLQVIHSGRHDAIDVLNPNSNPFLGRLSRDDKEDDIVSLILKERDNLNKLRKIGRQQNNEGQKIRPLVRLRVTPSMVHFNFN